ncbi:cGMP-dependent protein kinase 1 [Phytophthora boehmeriae]|uniref:cGMP-dependent protein kinase 1 n=1 Tax=Phytophthora boehmeriae TaxID=109152 RepID=A0A8T1WWJ7_9STRA|nr:cGMP-dependent protein kinase 1 [Phytophthora boehmeriae]
MGGGVSKSEYERIRKELIVKDQVIRTLQERLADGGYIGPMHLPPGGGGGNFDERMSEHSTASSAVTPVRPNAKEARVSNAEAVLESPKRTSFSSRLSMLGEAAGPRNEEANSRYGSDRFDSSFSMGAVGVTGSKGKVRRVEVSAEVMPRHNIKASQERVVYPKGESSRQLLLKVLQSNVLFQGQSHGELRDCLDAFFPMRVELGHLVIQQGTQGDNFYAVETGQLEILVAMGDASPIRYGYLGPGTGFGELALLYNMPRAATIRAVTAVELWALERNTFREILASHKVTRLNRTLQVLETVAILSKLTTSEKQQVAAAMDWEEFDVNAAIVRQGEVGEKFYIITKGEIVVTQQDASTSEEVIIRRLKAGDHFGEMALFKDEMRSATCTAVSRVQCVTLERAHFIAMLGTLQELMDREPAQLEAKDLSPRRASVEAAAEQDPAASYKYYMQIPREELEVLQTLGRGAFGRVRLVRHAASNRAYALKCLVKSHIVENNLKEHVLNEKRIRDDFDTSNFEDFRHEVEDPGLECDWDPDF